jgi:hypothetical protein
VCTGHDRRQLLQITAINGIDSSPPWRYRQTHPVCRPFIPEATLVIEPQLHRLGRTGRHHQLLIALHSIPVEQWSTLGHLQRFFFWAKHPCWDSNAASNAFPTAFSWGNGSECRTLSIKRPLHYHVLSTRCSFRYPSPAPHTPLSLCWATFVSRDSPSDPWLFLILIKTLMVLKALTCCKNT